MGLMKRGDTWYFKKMINGQRFVVSTGFADRKSAERRASEIEHDIRAGILGWKNNIPSFAEWWAIYKKTYTPMKSARNRDESIVAHFLPHFGARPLDEIRKSDMIRYLTFRRAQTTGCPGHKKRRQISESTVRRERGLLQAIFERAIEEGYDIRNPFRDLAPHLWNSLAAGWRRHLQRCRSEAHYAHLLKEDLVAASRQVRIPVAPRGTGSVVGAASASLRLVDGARACRSFVGSLLS